MWAGVVVVDPPCLDGAASLCRTAEQVLAQALVPEPPTEAPRTRLLRLARSDVVSRDIAFFTPMEDRVLRQLRTVFADDHGRATATLRDPVKLASDPKTTVTHRPPDPGSRGRNDTGSCRAHTNQGGGGYPYG